MRMIVKFSYHTILLVPKGNEAAMTTALMGCVGLKEVRNSKFESGEDPNFTIEFIDDSALMVPGSDESLAAQLENAKDDAQRKNTYWEDERKKTAELKKEVEALKAGMSCLAAKAAAPAVEAVTDELPGLHHQTHLEALLRELLLEMSFRAETIEIVIADPRSALAAGLAERDREIVENLKPDEVN